MCNTGQIMQTNTCKYLQVNMSKPVWWIRIGIYSQLSSSSPFSKNLKTIQTPHRLFWDFGADKTFTNPLVRR